MFLKKKDMYLLMIWYGLMEGFFYRLKDTNQNQKSRIFSRIVQPWDFFIVHTFILVHISNRKREKKYVFAKFLLDNKVYITTFFSLFRMFSKIIGLNNIFFLTLGIGWMMSEKWLSMEFHAGWIVTLSHV